MEKTMNEEQLLDEARSKGDQVAAFMRTYRDDFKAIVQTDPNQWTSNDHRLILGALHGMIGFLYEGRI